MTIKKYFLAGILTNIPLVSPYCIYERNSLHFTNFLQISTNFIDYYPFFFGCVECFSLVYVLECLMSNV